MTVQLDARTSNWCFVVPEDGSVLLEPTPAALASAAAAVQPGDWLYVAFANRWFPTNLVKGHGLTLSGTLRRLRSEGLDTITLYLALPEHRRPALLVDASTRHCLDYVFEHVFLPYLPGDSAIARIGRRFLAAAPRVALVLPHRLRVALAPSYYLLARRPA